MSSNTDPLLPWLQAYRDAVLAKDVDAFLSLYDARVSLFDTWENWTSHGIEAWRATVEKWFSSLGDETVKVEIAEVISTHSAGLCVGHAILTFTAFSAQGEELRSLDNRITVALKDNGGVWKALHEHTSVPIDHASMRPKLKRAG